MIAAFKSLGLSPKVVFEISIVGAVVLVGALE